MLTTAFFAALLSTGAAAGELWLTSADRSSLLSKSAASSCGPAAPDAARIDVAPSAARQPIAGFGASMTESAAIVLERLGPERRDEALAHLLGEKGLGLSVLRVPIGASDFSTHDYSCEDTAGRFEFGACMKHILPQLVRARKLNPRLKLMGSPWSAPAWMKDNGSMKNGSLKREHFPAYARYLARFSKEAAAAGAPMDYLTVVNEPGYGTDSYPTMKMTAEEQALFIGKHLGPALAALPRPPKILVWDHNWSSAAYAAAVLSDPAAAPYAAGSAFHCYEGAPEQMAPLMDSHPGKEIHFTECSAGGWDKEFKTSFLWAAKNLMVGNLRSGARSVLMWNLALDDSWGPTNNGCLDCRGLVTVAVSSKTYETTPEYYAFAHAALAASPDSVVVGSESAAPGLAHAAFKRPDGSWGLLAVNDTPRAMSVRVEGAGPCQAFELPALSAGTLRWRGP